MKKILLTFFSFIVINQLFSADRQYNDPQDKTLYAFQQKNILTFNASFLHIVTHGRIEINRGDTVGDIVTKINKKYPNYNFPIKRLVKNLDEELANSDDVETIYDFNQKKQLSVIEARHACRTLFMHLDRKIYSFKIYQDTTVASLKWKLIGKLSENKENIKSLNHHSVKLYDLDNNDLDHNKYVFEIPNLWDSKDIYAIINR